MAAEKVSHSSVLLVGESDCNIWRLSALPSSARSPVSLARFPFLTEHSLSQRPIAMSTCLAAVIFVKFRHVINIRTSIIKANTEDAVVAGLPGDMCSPWEGLRLFSSPNISPTLFYSSCIPKWTFSLMTTNCYKVKCYFVFHLFFVLFVCSRRQNIFSFVYIIFISKTRLTRAIWCKISEVQFGFPRYPQLFDFFFKHIHSHSFNKKN